MRKNFDYKLSHQRISSFVWEKTFISLLLNKDHIKWYGFEPRGGTNVCIICKKVGHGSGLYPRHMGAYLFKKGKLKKVFIFRACFKKLPRILCFNTMRYTFNMLTMLKEKVNTHFSFPMRLDMSGYVEKHLMPAQYQGNLNFNITTVESII